MIMDKWLAADFIDNLQNIITEYMKKMHIVLVLVI